mmetsp:Transcript_19884/g.29416  ORF Transcript_19884/g.29416 Transcript_19884/m.29416 type:complete len:297 (-) Transcript_19884:253-1143(-)|eukprot:CAMPEP_0194048922 /NCGR_PEP_ID=MMETSP0009_2-20130614/29002_1 /TAXON_ID=210454 /ORGANISM="Grammatophora oceanica, Strain CCMP 410" /LENGTH=296 /DNA_ID=CAMNT_0038694949 /DNA_START=42 /DNA_END=932 /DNA_ORIENTATION=+
MLSRNAVPIIVALALLLRESQSFISPSAQRLGCQVPATSGVSSSGHHHRRLYAKTEDSPDAATSKLIDKLNQKWDTLDEDGKASFLDTVDDDVPTMNEVNSEDDGRDAFVSEAIRQAMSQIDPKGEMRKSNVLDEEKVQEKIEEIFSKDTKQLYDEMEQIRKDQMTWANEWAEKKAKEAESRGAEQSRESQAKLDYAEKTYGKLLGSVSKEAQEVEAAMKELEAARAELYNGDMNAKLATAGPIKKVAVAGMLVFGVRAVVDAGLMVATDGGSGFEAGAAIQGAIALACAAYFFLS